MAIREGRWDCTQCGTKKIRGREMFCPGCGVKRANDTKFYLADGEPIVADPEQIKRAKKGADWYCGFCQRGNQNDSAKCSQCGADRNTSPAPRPQQSSQLSALNTVRGLSAPAKIGIASGILFAIFLVVYLIWPQRIDVEVTGFSWNRSIDIESYQTVIEDDWDIPAGGRKISQRREVRSYNRVLDHYESHTRQVQTGTEEYNCGTRDMGNGYFEDVTCSRAIYGTESYEEPVYRDDPVYDTKYTYKINKWAHARTATEEYSGPEKNPKWPETKLFGNGTNVLGNEREGTSSEKYTVHFISKDKKRKTFSQAMSLGEWKTFKYGATYEARLSFGNLSEFKLKP